MKKLSFRKVEKCSQDHTDTIRRWAIGLTAEPVPVSCHFTRGNKNFFSSSLYERARSNRDSECNQDVASGPFSLAVPASWLVWRYQAVGLLLVRSIMFSFWDCICSIPVFGISFIALCASETWRVCAVCPAVGRGFQLGVTAPIGLHATSLCLEPCLHLTLVSCLRLWSLWSIEIVCVSVNI